MFTFLLQSVVSDLEDLLQGAKTKDIERVASAASASVSTISFLKDSVIDCCATVPKDKQLSLLGPVKAMCMKLQDQIYSAVLAIGSLPS